MQTIRVQSARCISLWPLSSFFKSSNKTKHTSHIALLEYVALQKSPTSYVSATSPHVMDHVLLGVAHFCHPEHLHDQHKARNSYENAKACIKVETVPIKTNSITRSKNVMISSDARHVAALGALLQGRVRQALNTYEIILSTNPKDLLAIRTSHDLYNLLGEYQVGTDNIARILPYWNSSSPGYCQVLSMLAYGFVQKGDVTKAIEMATQTISMERNCGWAYNALADAHEKEGIHNIGASLLKQYKSEWEELELIKRHLYFHSAMFLYETADYAALDVMIRRYILPQEGLPCMNTIMDMLHLCWRLHFVHVKINTYTTVLHEALSQTNDLWLSPIQRIMKYSIRCLHPDATVFEFTFDDIEDMETSSLRQADYGTAILSISLPGKCELIQLIATDVCAAFLAYSQGSYSKVVDLLLPWKSRFSIISESSLDSDLLDLLLCESCLQADRKTLAEGLLNERITKKPNSCQAWHAMALLHERNENQQGAQDAHRLAMTLGLGQGGYGAA